MAFDLVGKAIRKLKIPIVDYSNSFVKPTSSQSGDINSRFFLIELFDDAGTINLSNYNKATLNATLEDGSVVLTIGEIDYKKNRIICKMPSVDSDMKLLCDISLCGIDGNNEAIYLTSQGFSVNVAKSQSSDEAIEADDNLPILVQLINEIAAISNVELARVDAEDKRVIVEEKKKMLARRCSYGC